jgi:hypothetical protein
MTLAEISRCSVKKSKNMERTDKRQIKMTLKMAVFWHVALCRLADIDQCCRGAYCLHHRAMEAVSSSEVLVNMYQTT